MRHGCGLSDLFLSDVLFEEEEVRATRELLCFLLGFGEVETIYRTELFFF